MKYLTVLIIICHFGYAQTYEATYRFEIKKEKVKKRFDQKAKEGQPVSPRIVNQFMSSEPIKAKLIFNDTLAYYYVVNGLSKNQQSLLMNPAFKAAGGLSSLYYNSIKDELIKKAKTPKGKEVLVKVPTYKFNTTNKLKQVNGYNSFLAQRHKNSSKEKIWYTTELPFQFGPHKYIGLPGLVIYIDRYASKSQLIKIETVSDSLVKLEPPNLPYMKLSELKALYDKTNPFKN